MNTANQVTAANMVRLELCGDVLEIDASKWTEAVDELVAKHPGKGAPKVTRIAPAAPTYAVPTDAQVGGGTIPGGDVTAAELAAQINASLSTMTTASVTSPTSIAVAPRTSGPVMASPRKRGAGLVLGSPTDVAPGTMDLVGRQRSTFDAAAAAAAGFAVDPPLYDRGTRVIELGVENAKQSRQDWEAMPLVRDNCDDHMRQIASEDRQDSVAMVSPMRMHADGTIAVIEVDGHPAQPVHYKLTEDAFASLVTRMQIPAGGRYLQGCWPELRADNVNAWAERMGDAERTADAAARSAGKVSEYTPIDMRIRHRALSRPNPATPDLREAFGIVGPNYADFDANKLDLAIKLATPPEARGRVSYDGRRSRWEILFQSTVQPKHFVAGEFFRAGVIVTTDDAGGGAIKGHAVALQNLCLNLIVIQTTTAAHFDIRHVGDVDKLAAKFRDGFGKAMGAIDHFVRAWDYAVEDNAVMTVRQLLGSSVPASQDEVMAGIFRHAIERELVPVRGIKTEPAVVGLMRAWREDESGAAGPTRAAVANAFTRWAHTTRDLTPWGEDEIQSAAGMLIKRTKKNDGWTTPLGYMAPEEVKGR